MPVPIPGFLLWGWVVSACGFFAFGAILLGVRLPALQLLFGGISLVAIRYAWTLITTRIDYVLQRLQLIIWEGTSALRSVGYQPPELYPTGVEPEQYATTALRIAAGAALVLMVGATLEALTYARTRKWWSIFIGLPLCQKCGDRVGFNMAFCPQCGGYQEAGRRCTGCREWLRDGYRYCPACGTGTRRET